MTGRGKNEGLSMGYRIAYRLRIIGLGLFGPAQLGEGNDPKRRLEREREDKVAEARAVREKREADEAARRHVA